MARARIGLGFETQQYRLHARQMWFKLTRQLCAAGCGPSCNTRKGKAVCRICYVVSKRPAAFHALKSRQLIIMGRVMQK